MEFLVSIYFWYAVSFAMFVALLWKYGKPAFLKFIDNRIEEIRAEIESAESMRTEAHELLAQYQRKHKDAVKDAEELVLRAEQQAEDIKKQAEKELDDTFKRREKQLQDRIARIEENAKEEIRRYVAELAMNTTSQIIAEQLDKKAHENLIDSSIKEIGKNIH